MDLWGNKAKVEIPKPGENELVFLVREQAWKTVERHFREGVNDAAVCYRGERGAVEHPVTLG